MKRLVHGITFVAAVSFAAAPAMAQGSGANAQKTFKGYALTELAPAACCTTRRRRPPT
jgi:hypothetical protein